jgi:hypothetical protein
VSGDSPDKFQTIQKRREGLLNLLQSARTEVLELALKGLEELDEVLGLCV